MEQQSAILILEGEEIYEFIAPIIEEELQSGAITWARDFDEAIGALHSGARFDFIVADWDLGTKYFISEVRNNSGTRNTPLLTLTDRESDNIVAQAFRSGASDVLPKPFLKKALVNKIRAIGLRLDRRRSTRVRPEERSWVRIGIEGGDEFYLELIDISIKGCQCRAPRAMADILQVYGRARVEFEYEGAAASIGSKLIRIEHDRFHPDSEESLLFAFYFEKMGEESDATLKQMIDDMWA